MKIKLYNKIAACGLERLPQGTLLGEEIQGEDGILVRSADLHETPFPESLKAIARAGAGVNNIPLDRCSRAGIAVFNTPGANANAVKELVLAGLFLTSRRVVDGISYSATLKGNENSLKLVEKEKSRFAGPEILGKKLGVIGLGAIGKAVAEAAAALGMTPLGYDPFAKGPFAFEVTEELDRIFAESDYITVHVPSLPATRGILGGENLKKTKKGVRLLNLARADLAVDEDIVKGLESGQIAAYFTDFPTPLLAGREGVIATPHLGASTPEAEDNCAKMACDQIADYLLNGNVKNSVNFPALSLERREQYRIGLLMKEGTDAEEYLAGASCVRATRQGLTYLLCEKSSAFDVEGLKSVGGVLRVTSY